jgi:FKBP-type peptidyl-prolyl cis-trans isomerase
MKVTLIPGALLLATAVAICAEKPAAKAAEEVKPATEAATPAVEAKPAADTAPAVEVGPAVEAVPAKPAVPDVSPELIKKNTSYGFGFQNGRQFAGQVGRYGIGLSDLDSAEFLKGFMTALANKDPEVAEKDIQDAMQALGALLEKREAALVISNLEAEKKFLAENGKRKEVTTTKSGLQYEVLTKGGDKKYVAPKEGVEDNKEFLVNYKGTLIDGKEFDKSPPGQPVPMTLQVVPGFKEAITTMPIGAKWKLFIPAALAYGDQRKSAELGPNSTLIFELELVDIKDAPPAPPEGGGFPMPQQPGQ